MAGASMAKNYAQEQATKALMDSSFVKKSIEKLHASILKDRGYQRQRMKLRSEMRRVFLYYGNLDQASALIRTKLEINLVKEYQHKDMDGRMIGFAHKLKTMQVQQQMQAEKKNKGGLQDGGNLGTNKRSEWNMDDGKRMALMAPMNMLKMSSEHKKMKESGRVLAKMFLTLITLERLIAEGGGLNQHGGANLRAANAASAAVGSTGPPARLSPEILEDKIDELLSALNDTILSVLTEQVESEVVSSVVNSITSFMAKITIDKLLNSWFDSVTKGLASTLQGIETRLQEEAQAEAR